MASIVTLTLDTAMATTTNILNTVNFTPSDAPKKATGVVVTMEAADGGSELPTMMFDAPALLDAPSLIDTLADRADDSGGEKTKKARKQRTTRTHEQNCPSFMLESWMSPDGTLKLVGAATRVPMTAFGSSDVLGSYVTITSHAGDVTSTHSFPALNTPPSDGSPIWTKFADDAAPPNFQTLPTENMVVVPDHLSATAIMQKRTGRDAPRYVCNNWYTEKDVVALVPVGGEGGKVYHDGLVYTQLKLTFDAREKTDGTGKDGIMMAPHPKKQKVAEETSELFA